MEVICTNCGAKIDSFDAVEVNTGRVQYMCRECWINGQKLATQETVRNYAKRKDSKRKQGEWK